MATRAGNFDTRITVTRRSETTDPNYGTKVVTWVPLVYAAGSPAVAEQWWAEVQDFLPSKSESVRNGVAMSSLLTRVRMRFRSDIDSTMRITVHRDIDTLYQIIAGPAMIGGRKEMIELVCQQFSTLGDAS